MTNGMEKGSIKRCAWYFLVALLAGTVFGVLEGPLLWGICAGVMAGLFFAALAKLKYI